jgi:hypothetical protein
MMMSSCTDILVRLPSHTIHSELEQDLFILLHGYLISTWLPILGENPLIHVWAWQSTCQFFGAFIESWKWPSEDLIPIESNVKMATKMIILQFNLCENGQNDNSTYVKKMSRLMI